MVMVSKCIYLCVCWRHGSQGTYVKDRYPWVLALVFYHVRIKVWFFFSVVSLLLGGFKESKASNASTSQSLYDAHAAEVVMGLAFLRNLVLYRFWGIKLRFSRWGNKNFYPMNHLPAPPCFKLSASCLYIKVRSCFRSLELRAWPCLAMASAAVVSTRPWKGG